MNTLQISFIFGFASIWICYFFTKHVLKYALRSNLTDIPNERSSHTRPTPRGGGLAIFICMTLANFGLALCGIYPLSHFFCIFIPAGGIAVLGWLDDRHSLSPRFRLSFQFLSSLLFLICLYFLQLIPVNAEFLGMSNIGFIFIACLLFFLWLTNLYNFMDGIDGIAGLEAFLVSAGSAFLIYISDYSSPLIGIYIVLAACNLGFLSLNWPPAKIFMGDVGSGYLGFCFAALAIYADFSEALSIFASVILLGAFIADASFTLIFRFLRKENIMRAHRDHAYQHAHQNGLSHAQVTTTYGLITLFWLFPLAWVVTKWPEYQYYGLLLAYVPLFAGALALKAGIRQKTEI